MVKTRSQEQVESGQSSVDAALAAQRKAEKLKRKRERRKARQSAQVDQQNEDEVPVDMAAYVPPPLDNAQRFDGDGTRYEGWILRVKIRLAALGLSKTYDAEDSETDVKRAQAIDTIYSMMTQPMQVLFPQPTPKALLDALEARYGSQSAAQKCAVKLRLANLQMGHFKRPEEYCDTVKKLCADSGETDEAAWLLNGLPKTTTGENLRVSLRTAMIVNNSTTGIREAICEAYRNIESSSSSSNTPRASAMSAADTRPTCHFCRRPGHIARVCKLKHGNNIVNTNSNRNGNPNNFYRNSNGGTNNPSRNYSGFNGRTGSNNYRGNGQNGGSQGTQGNGQTGQQQANAAGGSGPNSGTPTNQNWKGPNDPNPPRCYRCRAIGHISANCNKWGDNVGTARRPNNVSGTALMAIGDSVGDTVGSRRPVGSNEIVFLLDSGATNHFVNSLDYFVESREIRELVRTAQKGQFVTVTREGTIVLYDAENRKYTMEGVKYSEEFASNLLSSQRIREKGCKLEMAEEVCLYDPAGTLIVKSELNEDGLNEFRFRYDLAYESAAVVVDDTVRLWHRRLGHACGDTIASVPGNKIPSNKILTTTTCGVCSRAKMCRLPCCTERTKAKRVLELVHTDTVGPLPVSVDGCSYILMFLDDFTHFAVMYCLRNRSEVGKSFENYELTVTAKFGVKIHKLRCDNALEFVKGLTKSVCDAKGIIQQPAEPYVHEHNAKIERLNRTVVEKMRAMLYDAGMPSTYWTYAAFMACDTVNRLPTRSIGGEIPYEVWHNKAVDWEQIRIFGSLVRSFVTPEKRKKVEKKSNDMFLVGYTETGYWLLDAGSKELVPATHVKVDESIVFGDVVEVVDVTERYLAEEYDAPTEAALMATNVPQLTYEEAVTGSESSQWKEAIAVELATLQRMGTYKVVERPVNQKVLGLKWVFRKKSDNTYKARIVVLGYMERLALSDFDVYAPVIPVDVIRALVALAIRFGWQLRHIDITGAFLYGKLPYRVYVSIPKGFVYFGRLKDPVLELWRALYGLRLSPVTWYDELKRILIKIGLMVSWYCATLFIYAAEPTRCMVGVYVDDLLITGYDNVLIEQVLDLLKENFDVKDLGPVQHYLGVRFKRTDSSMMMDQNEYIAQICEKFDLVDADRVVKPVEDTSFMDPNVVVDPSLETLCRSMIGCLSYVANWTRPDIAYAVNLVARYQTKPSAHLVSACKRIIKYLKYYPDRTLCYEALDNSLLTAYSDSDHAGDHSDRVSTSGFIVFLYGCAIQWKSRKQKGVTRSSTEAEYLALADAVVELRAQRNLLKSLGFVLDCSTLVCDNSSAMKVARNTMESRKTRHIDVSYHLTKEVIRNGEVELVKVKGEHNVADVFTKSLAGTKINELMTSILVDDLFPS
ncbi:uncharacterized protein LOC135845199 [Planococcus citri]|uniref:uncharacterized protein LOC135845199 n=1 Tax=Planococcus citri TaxID=170843 RepID=UPI0031FA3258